MNIGPSSISKAETELKVSSLRPSSHCACKLLSYPGKIMNFQETYQSLCSMETESIGQGACFPGYSLGRFAQFLHSLDALSSEVGGTLM